MWPRSSGGPCGWSRVSTWESGRRSRLRGKAGGEVDRACVDGGPSRGHSLSL